MRPDVSINLRDSFDMEDLTQTTVQMSAVGLLPNVSASRRPQTTVQMSAVGLLPNVSASRRPQLRDSISPDCVVGDNM